MMFNDREEKVKKNRTIYPTKKKNLKLIKFNSYIIEYKLQCLESIIINMQI